MSPDLRVKTMQSATQSRESTCPSREVLLAYYDGKLPEIDLETIDSHLATCKYCLEFLDGQNQRRPVHSGVLFPDQESAKSSLLDTAFSWIRGDSELQRMKERAKAIIFGNRDETEAWSPPPLLPHKSDDDVLPEKIGPYLVADRLGRGAFANVYLASDPKTGQQVAIKVPRQLNGEEQIKEFLAEAQKSSKLAHAGIVRVFDFDRLPSGGCYVVMSYIEGRSLQKAMESERFSYERAAELCMQIADALDFVHQKGFIHRDIKPANILIDKEGHPHVADFGLAIHETIQHEFRNQLAGTWPYMSPEQVRGKSDHLDGRSDVWSLGVILYELLTRQKPFPSNNRLILEDQIQNRSPKPPRSTDRRIPKELEAICLRCLEKDVAARCSSAAEVAESLRSFLRRGRRTWRIGILGMGALVGSMAISLLVWEVGFRPSKKISLLENKPVVVFGSPRPDPFFDEGNQVYSVGPSKFRWIARVHRRRSEPIHLHATITLKDWVGAIGFAWQVHDLTQRSGESNRWFVAEYYRPNINATGRLVIQELSLSPGGVAGPSGIASQEVTIPQGSSAEVDLKIDERALRFSVGSETLAVVAPAAATDTQMWMGQGELTVGITGKGQATTFWKSTIESKPFNQ